MNNSNAPLNIMAAVQRVYSEPPSLVGSDNWPICNERLQTVMEHLRRSTTIAEQLRESVELMKLFIPYPQALARLDAELAVQTAVQNHIESELMAIAQRLGYDGESTQVLMIASFLALDWNFNAASVLTREEVQQRQLKMNKGGLGGGISIKFRNIRCDYGELAQLVASSTLTAYGIIDKPIWPIFIASALLTIYATKKVLTVHIDEDTTSVLWGFIQELKNSPQADEQAILRRTNSERQLSEWTPLSAAHFRRAVKELEKLGTIELEEGKWQIIENCAVRD